MTPAIITSQSNKQSEFLPFEMYNIPDEMRKRARIELSEDEDTRVNSLRLLRSMLREEKDLDWEDDELVLLSVLRARKFDVKRALSLTKNAYHVTWKRSELYYHFNFEDARRTFEDTDIGFLPYRDSEGCAILLIRLPNWNPDRTSLGDVMRALTTALIHANYYPATHIAGVKVIFDFKSFKASHLPHVSPTYLWLFGEALQNCFPTRFKAIHMVNEGYLFEFVWSVLKKFLTKKLQNRFYFHGKNVEKLHKHFSPRILPAEYGGELPPCDNTEYLRLISKSAEQITTSISHGYWKSRPCKAQEKEQNLPPN